ncbi:MAG: hypothetical protein U1E08_08950 [Coriobacteriia bacterium]|nr:hypothetical protein [Coriobacteriia bacterium]
MRPRILPMCLLSVLLVLLMGGLASATTYAEPDDCYACHAVDGLAAVAPVDFSAESVDLNACRACHAAIPLPTMATIDHFHNDFNDCTPCHNLKIDEPYFSVPAGEVIEPLVRTPYGMFQSVASPVSGADSIHGAHAGTTWMAQVLSPVNSWCASCHTQVSCNACHTDLAHGDHGGTPSCTSANCHLATAPQESPSCLGCHPAADGLYHGSEHASSTEGCDNQYCHQTPDLLTVHTQYNPDFTCSGCHTIDYAAQIAAGATECADCHETAHGDIAEAHTATASQECVDCHRSADLFELHADAAAGPCAVCHSTQLPDSAECVNCHAYSPVAENHYPADAHLAVPNAGCGNCHSLDLATEHAKYSAGCTACHSGSFDAVVADWDKTCDGCHPTRHKDRDSGGGFGGGSGGGSGGGGKQQAGRR